MDAKTYIEACKTLNEISEYDSDIYMSEAYEEMLKAADAGNREDNMLPLLQMQLASEEFKQNTMRQMCFAEAYSYNAYEEFVAHILKKKIARYSDPEQRAILTEMIGLASDLLEQGCDRSESLKMLEETTEALEARLTELISRLSFSMLDSCESAELGAEAELCVKDTDLALSAGAGACAAYLCDENMRRFPEMTGIVSEAVALTEEVISKEDTDDEDAVNVVGMMLACAYAQMMLSLLFTAALGVGFGAAVYLAGGAPYMLIASLTELFSSYLSLYVMKLRISVGARAAAMVHDALSFVKRAFFITSNTDEEIGIEESVAAASEEIYEEDDAE